MRRKCYPVSMLTAIRSPQNVLAALEPQPAGWILLVGPRSLNASLLTLIASLGERMAGRAGLEPPSLGSAAGPAAGSIRVLDGGNRFNAYTVARQARGRPEVLERITVSRAFTCYQALALLESTPASASPFVVLDLLGTFYDEQIHAGERKRLLRGCISQLKRLQAAAGGVVSIHPPAIPSPAAIELLHLLEQAAVDTYFVQPAAPAPEPLRLF